MSMFILMLLSFVLCDIANMAILASDVLWYSCEDFYNAVDMSPEEISQDTSVCNTIRPSIACYYTVAVGLALMYSMPAIVFVLVSWPHDCFHCLGMQPDNRISNF